jgi:hypothetical protein
MSALLKSKPRFDLPPRSPETVKARRTPGEHREQIDQAFAATFERYERAIEELAKRWSMPENSSDIRYLSVEDLISINGRLIAMKTPDEMSGVFSENAAVSVTKCNA